jgi:hypothetical protein
MIQPTLLSIPQAVTTSDDYYTPAWVFDRLGLIFDLDVCAPEGGVPWIPAARYFAMSDDGLSLGWTGRVWMNPPYSNVGPWWQRCAEHRNGVALFPLAKSCWLNEVWASADAIAIPEQGGEMHFYRPGQSKPLRIWFPVMFAAFGDECVDALCRVGTARIGARGHAISGARQSGEVLPPPEARNAI